MIFSQIKTFLRGIAIATARENNVEMRKKNIFRLSEFNFRQLHKLKTNEGKYEC